MIFYFSGTGNALYAAKKLVQQGERIISITKELQKEQECYEYMLKENEGATFVYPVYAWAPPKMVMTFIRRIKFAGNTKPYITSIAVCGDNIGNTMGVLEKALKAKGLMLASAFSVAMPNNYIIMGNIDLKEKEEKKLLDADNRLSEIRNIIWHQKKAVFELETGVFPKVITSVINPMFQKHGIHLKKFYATSKCIGCGICEKVCNGGCIKVDGTPSWQGECTQCLACIHYCPTGAIQYGKGTERKGRYKNPNITLEEMKVNEKY